MKTFLTIVFVGILGSSFAQTQGKWSVGVGATPAIDGITMGVYVNRHLSEHWQVGLLPFGNVYSSTGFYYKTKNHSLGLNLNARYMLTKWKVFGPYAYTFAGVGQTKSKYEGIYYPVNEQPLNYTNISIGVGTQIYIGSKGWSIDVNGGYFWYSAFNTVNKFRNPIYSIGVFKQF